MRVYQFRHVGTALTTHFTIEIAKDRNYSAKISNVKWQSTI